MWFGKRRKMGSQEQLDKAYRKALRGMFPTKNDVLLLDVKSSYNKNKQVYQGITITSFNEKINLFFNTKDFVKDFSEAMLRGNEIIALGGFENKRFEMSYNMFSGGIFLSSTCDDFIEESNGKYSYICRDEENEDFDVLGIKKHF